MRLSLSLGYQTAWTTPADHLALAQEADRLGYSCVWASEAYGSDAATMLAWIAGQTSRIDVGSRGRRRARACSAIRPHGHRAAFRNGLAGSPGEVS